MATESAAQTALVNLHTCPICGRSDGLTVSASHVSKGQNVGIIDCTCGIHYYKGDFRTTDEAKVGVAYAWNSKLSGWEPSDEGIEDELRY